MSHPEHMTAEKAKKKIAKYFAEDTPGVTKAQLLADLTKAEASLEQGVGSLSEIVEYSEDPTILIAKSVDGKRHQALLKIGSWGKNKGTLWVTP